MGNRDSVVGIATGCGLDDSDFGFRVPVGSRIFSSSHRPGRVWGPPTSYPVGTGPPFPGVKAAGA
jgi:hypothetical protein